MTLSWPVASAVDPFADDGASPLADVWNGARSLHDFLPEARARGLDGPLPPGPPPRPAPRMLTDADLARIAADQDPGIGASAPDRVLGPWADDADRASLLAAMVHGVFLPSEERDAETAAEGHLRADRGRGADTVAVRAVARTPLAPFRLHGDRAVPFLPIGAVPDGPVRIRPIAYPAGAGHEGGELVFARIVRGPDTWEAVAPIAVPAWPAAVPVWVRILAWEERLVRPCATLDELLARRGHALLRRVLEDAWR